MKLIVGLGNPDSKYALTRHNIGWRVIDYLANKLDTEFAPKSRFQALVAETSVDGQKVLLVKPTTYYNLTGQSVRKLADYHKISTTDILVIHDDLDLPAGTLRLRGSGSDAGNNGIKSLNSHLGPDYARLRIGIANQYKAEQDSASFVLSPLSKAEQATLESMSAQIFGIVEDFIANRHQSTTYTHSTD